MRELKLLFAGIIGFLIVLYSFLLLLSDWPYKMIFSMTGLIVGILTIIFSVHESLPNEDYEISHYDPAANIYILFAVIIATFTIAFFLILQTPYNAVVLFAGMIGSIYFGMKLKDINTVFKKR